jgi:DNA-directed RNA polymerase subunit RPC12/RpoP
MMKSKHGPNSNNVYQFKGQFGHIKNGWKKSFVCGKCKMPFKAVTGNRECPNCGSKKAMLAKNVT